MTLVTNPMPTTELPELKDNYAWSLGHYTDPRTETIVPTLKIVSDNKSHYFGVYDSQKIRTHIPDPRQAILDTAEAIHKQYPHYFKDYQDPIPHLTEAFNDLMKGTSK